MQCKSERKRQSPRFTSFYKIKRIQIDCSFFVRLTTGWKAYPCKCKKSSCIVCKPRIAYTNSSAIPETADGTVLRNAVNVAFAIEPESAILRSDIPDVTIADFSKVPSRKTWWKNSFGYFLALFDIMIAVGYHLSLRRRFIDVMKS